MIVQLEHIQKTFQSENGEIEAIRDISLNIDEGEFISVVGPSGCGKSTLLSIVAGLEPPTGGTVLVENIPVTKPSPALGFMPQKDQLFPWRSIWGNVTLGLELQGDHSPVRTQHVENLLERYGLHEFMRKSPNELSGGMRQRCALIRTLAVDPKILLLDEPFSALDYQTRLAVSNDIASIIREEQKTAILVTHDIAESISMSDRVVVLSARPTAIKSIHILTPLHGLTPMERRNHPAFHTFFNEIWKELELSV